jgi:hypothetical protein
MAKLAEVYRRAGLDLDASTRDALERYLAEHPRGRDGQVRYHLERDFGVSPSELRGRFGFYFDRFPVRIEGAKP